MGPRRGLALIAAVLMSSCMQVYDPGFKDSAATRTGAAGPAGQVLPPSKSEASQPATADAPDPTVATAETPLRPSSTGLLAMFKPASREEGEQIKAATTADPATTTAAVPDAAADTPGPDEISEADLAGETEADPSKIAVPEEPADDGMSHDFVNVYTSHPEKPEDSIEGLPGVTWSNDIIMASRGSLDDDPRSLFGGDNHPFAQTVPGVPHEVVQAANGLLLAYSSINVSCIKPDLLGLVRRAESQFGHKVVVTSGYRSPSHNRRVRGALHSQHLYCNALDLYMPGVARDDLARFFYAQPDRGGLGLYCHTRSIHVDTGPRRQWRWSCSRRG